jgi:hypothetical protein
LILTPHAKLEARANGLAPGTTQRVLSLVARVLPEGGTAEPLPGKDIGSALDESLLTAVGRRARADLNQP